MHNLTTVIKFEILKQIRKPLFWVSVFAFPALMLVFGGVSFFSTKLAHEQTEKTKEETSSVLSEITVVDKSGLIKSEAFGQIKINFKTDANQALDEFKNSDDKALVIYETDVLTKPTKIYTKNENESSKSQELSQGVWQIAKLAIVNSVTSDLEPQATAIITAPNLPYTSTILNSDGSSYDPFKKMIAPGIFTVVFFIIFTMTGSQILTATTEEKENRTAEMILTTVKAQSLIVGKIIALVILGFIQISALILPIIIAYLVATSYFDAPPFVLEFVKMIEFEMWPTIFGVSFLVFGFLLTTSLTILAGSMFPTAQDAAQFFTPIILSMMLPMYFASAIVSGVNNAAITFLSFFPLSSPMTLLLRNMSGYLPIGEGIFALIVMIIFTILAMVLAVKSFKSGAFEYSKKGSFKELFKELLFK